MQQAIHILKKDVRHLRLEIALVAAAAGLYAVVRSSAFTSGILYASWWPIPLALASAYLIARVIHAEPAAGDSQFWITRPYRWPQLLAAKLLFVVLFVNVPVFVAQLVVFGHAGFPFLPHVDGLLWSFLTTILVVSFPVAAFAALTPGMAQFILWGILVAVIGSSIPGGAEQDWPSRLQWIRYTVMSLFVMGTAGWTLWSQYGTRESFRNRLIAALVLTVGLVLPNYIPLSLGIGMQSRLSAQDFDEGAFELVVPPLADDVSGVSPGAGSVRVALPLQFEDIPNGTTVVWNVIDVAFVGPDSEVWDPAEGGFWQSRTETGGVRTFMMPRRLYEEWRQDPTTVRGYVFFTVYGNSTGESFRLSSDPVGVAHGFQCYQSARTFGSGFTCRRPFRSSGHYVAYAQEPYGMAQQPRTYSPFPSGIDLNREFWAGASPSFRIVTQEGFDQGLLLDEGDEVTLTFSEPLAHLRRDFAFTIDLNEYVFE